MRDKISSHINLHHIEKENNSDELSYTREPETGLCSGCLEIVSEDLGGAFSCLNCQKYMTEKVISDDALMTSLLYLCVFAWSVRHVVVPKVSCAALYPLGVWVKAARYFEGQAIKEG